MSLRRIEEFLSEKTDWIERHLKINAARLDETADVLAYRKVYVNGNLLPFVICDRNEITCDAVYVSEPTKLRILLEENFVAQFSLEVEELASRTGLKPATVKIKGFKSRWGCCNADKVVSFNYKLFMVAPELRRYVIIHELCHLKFLNHSHDFWRLVSSFDAEWKKHRQELKKLGYLCSLFT